MPKSFQDLIDEVHSKGICQECGGCVSFCSSADYNIIGFPNPNAPPEYINKEKCLECGICYCLCPQTHYLHDELDSYYKISDFHSMPLGQYHDVISCQANDPDFLRVGTDGGVVNSIINFLIEEKEIDGAIVSKSEAPFLREATIAYNKDDLIKASGATLNITPQLTEVQKYCTYTHSIPELNHYKFKKLAVVGTPCQIYTMRSMQNLGVTPSENIEICLGLFCYENFSFDKSQTGKFEKDFNFKFEDIKKINIKEDVIFKISNNGNEIRTIHVPFNHLTDYMRPACNACSDFSNLYADISFGGLGSPDKYTTVITRTKKGKDLISKAINSGIINSLDMDLEKKEKVTNLLTQFALKKIDRYLSHMEIIQ
ncbi:MAG: Coenzyme F420 hydrogenase/dehydrogenase, beta subunit C-terminal domain [Promethearchaeota archaeon]